MWVVVIFIVILFFVWGLGYDFKFVEIFKGDEVERGIE